MQFLAELIAGFRASPLGSFASPTPWDLIAQSSQAVTGLIDTLDEAYSVSGNLAIHRTASIEAGALIKGPAIIGPHCFIAAGAYVRGGCWLAADCTIGPGAELKSSFLFNGSKLAHFNFVGDSILGSRVNLEAGAVIANYRNERPGSIVSFYYQGAHIDTGLQKFGALVGDDVKIGANAVIAPGAILTPKTIVGRLSLVDQEVSPLA